MATLVRYNPFFASVNRRNALDRLVEQSFGRPTWSLWNAQNTFAPVNVSENEHGYQVSVQLPGLKPEEIDVTLQQNTLTIKGQHSFNNKSEKENWLVQEFGSSSFARSVTFPKAVDFDKIETSYENGILTISAPFGEGSRPKRINVTGSQPEQIAPQQETPAAEQEAASAGAR